MRYGCRVLATILQKYSCMQHRLHSVRASHPRQRQQRRRWQRASSVLLPANACSPPAHNVLHSLLSSWHDADAHRKYD